MRLRPFLILIVILTEVLTSRVDFSLSSAASSILDQGFADSFSKVDFLLCGNKNGPSEILFNQIRRQFNNSLSVQLKSCETVSILLNTSSVLLFDSADFYKENFRKISWQRNQVKRYRQLVHIANGTINDVSDSIVDRFSIDNTAFLVDEPEKSIRLVTSYMFTNDTCWENQLVSINRFGKRNMRWESNNFFPNKYRNFHACYLHKVIGLGDTEQSLFDEVFAELSVIHNFKIKKSHISSLEEFNVLKKPTDMIKVVTGLDNAEFVQVVLSDEHGVYIIPHGEPLTHLQKFLSPFDSATWLLVFGTLTTIVVMIQLLNFASERVKALCFGRNFESPTMNLMNVFLCGGQAQDPQNNFSRYLFMLVLVWSLIIRTSFQSLSYRSLQLDTRHPPMRTFNDLKENKFSQFIVTRPDGFVPRHEFENAWYSIPASSFNDSMNLFEIIAEPANKRTMQLSLEYIEKMEKYYFRSGKSSLTLLDEDIRTLSITFPMLPFNPFFEEFKDKIQRLVEAGICPKRLIGNIIAASSENKRFNEDVPPLVLTLDDLGIGFTVCLIPLGMSVIVFIAEIVVSKILRP